MTRYAVGCCWSGPKTSGKMRSASGGTHEESLARSRIEPGQMKNAKPDGLNVLRSLRPEMGPSPLEPTSLFQFEQQDIYAATIRFYFRGWQLMVARVLVEPVSKSPIEIVELVVGSAQGVVALA